MNNESSKTIEGLNANRLSHGINDNIFFFTYRPQRN